MVQDVCDQVLRQAFGIRFDEVAALAGTVSAAYKSVSYCLDELSHIVRNSGLDNAGTVLNGCARGGYGSNNVSICPAGAGTGSTGGGSGAGGGSRKRASGSQDSGDSGGTDGGAGGSGAPGGGKRPKLAAAQHQSTDMNFSCPFRKKNPAKFNVREFRHCAVQSFPDMAQLK
jgi:hypothetical protein